MSPQTSSGQQRDAISVEPWWSHHGFTENPFALREAGQEPRLSEYFVHGPDYDEIRGTFDVPRTAVVFAARGCGKSAYRRMIQSSCRPADEESAILAVPHVEFHNVLSASGDPASVTLGAHVEELLRSAATTSLAELLRRPTSFDLLPPAERSLLKWFVHTYARRSLRPSNLAEELVAADGFPAIDRRMLAEVTRSPDHFLDWLEHPPAGGDPRAQLLSALLRAEPAPPPERTRRNPVTLVQEYVDLIRQVGLEAVYFLVDGLDELAATSTDPTAAAALVAPLLAEPFLIELPHVAFKFFLPAEAAAALQMRRDSRLDRLPIYRLAWREADLERMLELRLLAFNERGIDSLSAISEQDVTHRIDQDLVEMACGSPRRLLMLGDALFAAHTTRPEAGLLLNQQDWEAGCRSFELAFGPLVPPLHVDREAGKVFIGGEELSTRLSPTEFELLAHLYQAEGRLCSRDDISHALHPDEGVISDEAFDSLVLRLRRKIERHPRRPVYLVTERGLGYRLENVG